MRLKYFQVVSMTIVLMGMSVAAAIAGDVAITNATLVTVTGETIENGTLLILGDRIADLGADVTVPPGVEVIDAEGLFVYPGMIDASSSLGLYEVGAVRATVDVYEMGTYNPHIRAEVALNPHSVHIPITRVNGVTSALVVPAGGIITGQSALIHLWGRTPEEMVVKAPVAIHINFPRLPREDDRRGQPPEEEKKEDGKEKTEKQIEELIDVFLKAKRYAATWEAFEKSQKRLAPEKDLMLEALVPVVKDGLPVIIAVHAEKDIKNAVDFVDTLGIKAIFQGINDGWKVAPLLKEKNIPVLVGPVLSSPGPKDPYDAVYANAGILHEAGVKVAFLTESAADARSLPYHAGTAAAFGLPREEALRAVTINPAEILGVANLLGSLEKGKLANVIVTDGDPLEMRTQIKHVFIAGEKIDLSSKHAELYEKFRKRPPPKQ
jgi:imidazolonepropionase-like amidohydrolase